MDRNAYNNYLNDFDVLMAKIENPGISRQISSAVKNGMRVEEIAFFYGVSVDSIQNDLEILERIQILTQNVSKEL